MKDLSEKSEQIEENQNNILEVIQVENLKKRYKHVTALDGISFSVKRREVFGFLGSNGV